MTPRSLAQIVAGVALAGALNACSEKPSTTMTTDATPAPTSSTPMATQPPNGPQAKVLSSTAWQTTGAKDVHRLDMPLTDEAVKSWVGYAYFSKDGTFATYNLDDSSNLKGDWAVSADGKKWIIVAKGPDGDTMFTRGVDIVTLTPQTFTYRIFPDENDRSVYYDIIHAPTNHPEPGSAPTTSPDATLPGSQDSGLEDLGDLQDLDDQDSGDLQDLDDEDPGDLQDLDDEDPGDLQDLD